MQTSKQMKHIFHRLVASKAALEGDIFLLPALPLFSPWVGATALCSDAVL